MDPAWPGVFVSSTCKDLVDLRAELHVLLDEMSFAPMLSDRLLSEFETPGYANAIETCLANVRKCPIFICVLSERYGWIPPGTDVSVTHLEYREAQQAPEKAIHFYVREGLNGAYEEWIRKGGGAGDVPASWDPKLLAFMHERAGDLGGEPGGWKWPFGDSVELKARIAFDLKKQSRRLRFQRMLEEGRAPDAYPVLGNAHGRDVKVSWTNFGPGTAFSPRFRFSTTEAWTTIGHVVHGQPRDYTIQSPMVAPEQTILVRYATHLGEVIEDTYRLELKDGERAKLTRLSRGFVDGRDFEIV